MTWYFCCGVDGKGSREQSQRLALNWQTIALTELALIACQHN